MKKYFLLTLSLVIFILGLSQLKLEASSSASFKISVTIPHIVGVNIPRSQAHTEEIKKEAVNEENIQLNCEKEVTVEEIIRDGQPIILETVVLK
ncbi:MAG: hypothetical protein JW734_09510 [Candidatus Omnitrophica bacterium]|nr:hypothetical protein [Candidatus Omnitrophota bacterium]